MRILYIGNFSLPDNDAAATRVMGNALALREGGEEVIFLDAQKGNEIGSISGQHFVNGFKVYSRFVGSIKIQDYLECMFCIKNVVKIIKKEVVDLVIAYNYSSIALNKIRRFCNRNGIICVSDCTEWYSANNYKFPFSLFCALDTFYRMRIVNKKCDGIITVSSYLDRFYSHENHIRVPFFIDCKQLDLVDSFSNFNSQFLNIIYSGAPGRNKDNIQEVVHGLKKSLNYDKMNIRIVGITMEEYLEMYPEDKWVKDDYQIIFLGRISRKDNLSLVKASDFFIFFRKSTRQNMAGFPTKFVEAVSLGVPIITTNTSDLLECSLSNKIPTTFISNEDGIANFFSKEIIELKNFKKKAFDSKHTFDFKGNSNWFCVWVKNLNCSNSHS